MWGASHECCKVFSEKPCILDITPGEILTNGSRYAVYLGDRTKDPTLPAGYGQGREPHVIVHFGYHFGYHKEDKERLFFDGFYCNALLDIYQRTGRKLEADYPDYLDTFLNAVKAQDLESAEILFENFNLEV